MLISSLLELCKVTLLSGYPINPCCSKALLDLITRFRSLSERTCVNKIKKYYN